MPNDNPLKMPLSIRPTTSSMNNRFIYPADSINQDIKNALEATKTMKDKFDLSNKKMSILDLADNEILNLLSEYSNRIMPDISYGERNKFSFKDLADLWDKYGQFSAESGDVVAQCDNMDRVIVGMITQEADPEEMIKSCLELLRLKSVSAPVLEKIVERLIMTSEKKPEIDEELFKISSLFSNLSRNNRNESSRHSPLLTTLDLSRNNRNESSRHSPLLTALDYLRGKIKLPEAVYLSLLNRNSNEVPKIEVGDHGIKYPNLYELLNNSGAHLPSYCYPNPEKYPNPSTRDGILNMFNLTLEEGSKPDNVFKAAMELSSKVSKGLFAERLLSYVYFEEVEVPPHLKDTVSEEAKIKLAKREAHKNNIAGAVADTLSRPNCKGLLLIIKDLLDGEKVSTEAMVESIISVRMPKIPSKSPLDPTNDPSPLKDKGPKSKL